jgi:hypothetical protein
VRSGDRKSRRPPASLSACVLALASLYLPGAGCNLFSTRDPDVSEDVLSIWEPPVSPEIVVRNLENALESATFNNYRRALTEDFAFLPDDGDVFTMQLERPGEDVYENWDRDVETSTAEIIRNAVPELRLDLTVLVEELEGQGRLRKYSYVLTLGEGDGDEEYRGEAWFRIRQEPSGEWLIYGWEDKSVPGASSWGLLKGRSRVVSGTQALEKRGLARNGFGAEISGGRLTWPAAGP